MWSIAAFTLAACTLCVVWISAVSKAQDAGAAGTMQRVSLPTAKCIDGSEAIYYISQAPVAGEPIKKVVIWLEGGGICQSSADCAQRATGQLGTSTKWPAVLQNDDAGKALLLNDATVNPDFAEGYTKVFVPYCSGDVWLGQSDPSVPLNPFHDAQTSSFKGYFHGHRVVEEVIESLGIAASSSTEEVLLTGCSAGGIGTFGNCDYVADQVRGNAKRAKVRCRPEAGYFGLGLLSYSAFAAGAQPSDEPDMHHLWHSNWTVNVNPFYHSAYKACVAAGPAAVPSDCPASGATNTTGARGAGGAGAGEAGEEGNSGGSLCCALVPYFYPFIKTPLFVSEDTADSYQVYTQGECPRLKTKAVFRYVAYLRAVLAGDLHDRVARGTKRAQDGLFAPACLRHCMLWADPARGLVNGRTHQQAFGDWYFGRTPSGSTNMNLDNSTDSKALLSCAD
eukprot:g4576.t1